MNDIYRRIKLKRQELGLTQADLAKRLGYADKAVISKIEHGEVDLPLSKVEAFANALGVNPGDLMGDVPVMMALSKVERAVIIGYRQLSEDKKDVVNVICGVEKEKREDYYSSRKEA